MKQQNINEELEMLATQVMAGDAAAYNTLLARLGPALRAYFARQFRLGSAAEDLAQETLLAIHTKFHTYQPSSPFVPWLFAIAKYKAIDYLRRTKCRTIGHEIALEESLQAGTCAEAVEQEHDIAALLGNLSARDRELLQLAKVEGRSLKEISEQMNLSLASVKAGIHRAMKRLTGLASEERI